jgi:signal recognition particle GTPase
MEKELLKTTPLPMRAEILRNSCYKVLENEFYTRKLEEEEVAEAKTELFERDVELESIEEELKELKASYSKKMKDLYARRSELIKTIQFESVSQRGTVFLMDDQQSGIMGIYDVNGFLINSRPMKPDERQGSLLTIMRTGTDDE